MLIVTTDLLELLERRVRAQIILCLVLSYLEGRLEASEKEVAGRRHDILPILRDFLLPRNDLQSAIQ